MNRETSEVKSAPALNVARLITAYYTLRPDPAVREQRVAFGTSGHRGGAFDAAFNEAHILAITQAICEYRRHEDIAGPLFLGMDTHALSEPAFASALEVLAANDVEVMIDRDRGWTPTPVVSHAILNHNRGRKRALADGILITPSHNPPGEGGFKYNSAHGGPADTAATAWIEERANALIAARLRDVKRVAFERAIGAPGTHAYDYINNYVGELDSVLDMDAIARSGLRIGVDPMGGAGVRYWPAIIERYRLPIEIVNDAVDPAFSFMAPDWDGKIRMDCSSPHAMAPLVALRARFDLAFANDADNDRHGIVTPAAGLMNPNHYLAVAISHLFPRRSRWGDTAAVGKTVVSSAILDRVAASVGRRVIEVPVGFKWFVAGLLDGSLGFGGEESAGASFLRRDGAVWTTDKDGIIMGLLAAEVMTCTGKDPGELYAAIARELGEPVYERADSVATPEQKQMLKRLAPGDVTTGELAGEPITAILTTAPGNQAPIGGLKIVSESGWFAVRPSGTENVYKIYAESFRGTEHLRRIKDEARALVERLCVQHGLGSPARD